jgi:hypothetical protein
MPSSICCIAFKPNGICGHPLAPKPFIGKPICLEYVGWNGPSDPRIERKCALKHPIPKLQYPPQPPPTTEYIPSRR